MTKSRPIVMCLGGGIEGLPIIQKVDRLGYCPIVLDLSESSPGFLWARENPDRVMAWQCDAYNPRSVLSTVSRVWNHSKMTSEVAGVLCCAVDAPDSQAILAKKFRTPSIGVECAIPAKDKWIQYEWLSKHNIPVPPTKLIEKWGIVEHPGYEIIKPVIGRGARGVSRFTSDTYGDRLREAFVQAPAKNKKAIIQKRLRGIQLSTESVIQNGHILFTAVFERNYSRLDEFYPYIIEDGIDGPYWLKPDHYRNLESLLLRASLCMGWDNCTVKGDIVFDGGAFFVIELAPRLSGGYMCTHSTPMAYEYDFLRSAIQLAVGGRVNEREEGERRDVCQRYLFPRPEWIGKTFAGKATWIGEESVFLTIHKNKGHKISPVTSHADRLGQCLVSAENAIAARAKCEAYIASAMSQIEVQ